MTQIPMFQPKVEWKPPTVSSLPSWKGAKRVSIDTETKDPLLKKLGPGVRRGGKIVGYSFTIEDGPSYYVPIRHQGGDNVEDPQGALDYLRQQTALFKGSLCGANMAYDMDYMAEEGIVFRNVKRFLDCQIAEPLIDELQYSYSLDNIAKRRDFPGKDEELLRKAARDWKVNPKSELWKLPARFIAPYAIQDTELPLQLLRRQERDIADQELEKVWELESKTLPIMVKMRRRGVNLDTEHLQKVHDWTLKEEAHKLKFVEHETGVHIPVGHTERKEEVSNAPRAIGITLQKTKSGQDEIKAETLQAINHPVADALARAKKVAKLRTTFCESVWNHMTNGRIHCSFNQLRQTSEDGSDEKGARYGRLSSSNPNLQQQPSRDDFASFWRKIYVPDDGGIWACCDYSQQEPRMLVHFAELTECQGAQQAANLYRNNPNADNHSMMARIIYGYKENEEPSKVHRTNAKIIFLGICYGKMGRSLAVELGLPTKWITNRKSDKQYEVAGDEAQSIMDQFDRRVPFVKQMSNKCERRVKKVGYIKTISGRRCRFPLHRSGKGWDKTYRALNRLVQGSSADQTKMAMIALDEAGVRIQLQVHDEIDLTVSSPKEAENVGKIMRECLPLRVPSKVDVEIGPSWGEIK